MQPRNDQMAHIVDASNNNGTIDWKTAVQQNIAGAIFKVTEGVTYHDPTFQRNLQGALDVGLPVGGYCFARPRTSSANDEADEFARTLEAAGGHEKIKPVLDLEDNGGLSREGVVEFVHTFMERLKGHFGDYGMLYTYTAFAQAYLDDSMSKYDLWIADYRNILAPPDVAGHNRWKMWQFTSKASIPGFSGAVDLSVFDGTVEDFRAWCGLVGKVQTPARAVVTAPSSTRPTLRMGDKGADVIQLQLLLYRIGQHPGAVDGIFGVQTQSALKAFQAACGIAVDGICGPQSWSHLLSAHPASRPLLALGSRGDQVTDAQYLLAYHHQSVGTVDGLFGPKTDSATRSFQKANGLQVDGKIGPQTWNALLKL
ncbi:GH25 family lysozyme [Alicyclobacillus shizuokensis]|uniref:GH25 family lysozyme n=1 Tax=Alicyclobacillus shizuokensis TaxID=392014 RepID=UPI000830ED99|nr:GH25 family lysozyme [Alicyclobacillus shizuokensis]